MSIKFPLIKKRKLPTTGIILILGLLGLTAISVSSSTGEGNGWQIFGSLFLLGIAFTMMGLLVGTLFGIPKSSTNGSGESSVSGNTNLEEVSDWLTKIIIGFGIAELSDIDKDVLVLAQTLNEMMPGLPIFSILLTVIYFPIYGFLSGWLLTRVYLTTIIADTDQQVLEIQKRELKTEVDEAVEGDQELDANKVNITADLTTEEIIERVNTLEIRGKLLDGETYHKLGIILVARRNYEMASNYFQKSYDLNKKIKSLVNIGVIKNKGLNEPEESLRIFTDILRENPESALALYNLACVQTKLNMPKEAIKNLTQALKLGGLEFEEVAVGDAALKELSKSKEFKKLLPRYDAKSDHNII